MIFNCFIAKYLFLFQTAIVMGIKFSNSPLGDENSYLATVLPNEIFFPICDHLSLVDISRLAQTCRHLNTRINQYLNSRVSEQKVQKWHHFCSEFRELLSPDEQVLVDISELTENKHLYLFLSVYSNIHGENLRRFSTSEHL